MMKQRRLWPAVVVMAALALVGVWELLRQSKGGSSGSATGPITVWVDAARLPVAKAYPKAHPNVKVNIVTFDGDGNGATTLQTKIQLWNRTGNGWPDVIFSEQVNDPVWMAQKPFEFAAPIKDLIPDEPAQPVAGAVDRAVHGQRHAVLRPGQPRPGGALGEQEADGRLRLHRSRRPGRSGPRSAQKVATEHPGYIVGNIGDSFSHWIYLWGNQCPLPAAAGQQADDQLDGHALHRDGRACSTR